MTETHSLVHQIAHWAQHTPNAPAQHDLSSQERRTFTWAEYWDRVRRVAAGLIKLGHQPGECVALVGANCPEWVHAEFGIQAARGIVAPIYVTNTVEQHGYVVKHSRAKVAFCDGTELLEKYLEGERRGCFEPLEHLITFDAVEHDDPRVQSLHSLLTLGSDEELNVVDQRLGELTDEETCLLIYTSGTTGVPKGVELNHGGQLMIGESVISLHPEIKEPGRYRSVSYLPLCHQAEQLFTNIFSLMTGGQVYFCPDLAQIKDYLLEAQPSVFLGVPRVWEKFEAALQASLSEATGLKGALASWAMRTELACFREQMRRGGESYNPLRRTIARKLVINKIKAKLGMDRLEIAVTGAAPISVSTQEFFASLGICIYEGYGLSETSGVATITDFKCPRFGTVGRPLPGVEVRISKEKEIQLRGRNNTCGYLHMPEETAELYTEDGWLRTGDLGSVDDEGNVSITGRMKEILITAGGKNVAPAEMENHIKSIEGIGQVVVVGDRKPYLCALITLDPENVNEIASASGLPGRDLETLVAEPQFHAWLEDRIETVCNQKVARYQTIKKFHLFPHDFSVEGGELTPTMKLRRKEIHAKYQDIIEGLYGTTTSEAATVEAAPSRP